MLLLNAFTELATNSRVDPIGSLNTFMVKAFSPRRADARPQFGSSVAPTSREELNASSGHGCQSLLTRVPAIRRPRRSGGRTEALLHRRSLFPGLALHYQDRLDVGIRLPTWSPQFSPCPAARSPVWSFASFMTVHIPVLLEETLEWLKPEPGKVFLDGTLGGGGHTRALAELVGPDGLVIGLDRDPVAVEKTSETLRGLPVMVANASYSDAPEVLQEAEVSQVDGILLDLGLSSDQLEDRERGFSFHAEGPLDLRFDATSGEPAYRLVNRLSSDHLANLIYRYGEERCSRRIARAICERRREKPIETALDLAEIIRRAVPRNYDPRIDPATRSFQALRIAVNEELAILETALERLPALLAPGGRLAIISFHSLEDRLVKTAFRHDDRLQVLTAKPIVPTEAETHNNPRARSSKLRVAECG